MNINQIKSQLSVNRAVIRDLHYELEDYQSSLRYNYSLRDRMLAAKQEPIGMDEDHMNFYKGLISGTRRKIAKMVVLQKALKKDMALEVCIQRIFNGLSKVEVHGEVYE